MKETLSSREDWRRRRRSEQFKKGRMKKKKSATVKWIQVMCALYTGEWGGDSPMAPNMAATGSSCVQSGWLARLRGSPRARLWRASPTTGPDVQHPGHLGATSAGCGWAAARVCPLASRPTTVGSRSPRTRAEEPPAPLWSPKPIKISL